MRSRKWITGAAVVAAAVTAAARQARAADLLFDDFSAASLDTSKWSLGTWQLGRTQLGFTPQLTGGMARLRHDTYNPSNPGGTFRGTEILSNSSFTRGSGLEYEARVRTNAMPSGLVTSFFTYVAQAGSPPLADEIDFEFLTKQVNASNASFDPVLMTTWNNFRTDGSNFGDPNVHSSVNSNVSGLDLAQFNTFKIRWLPDRVQWYVNGVPTRTAYYAVPDLAAPIRANFWAPGSEWGDAYAASLSPTANPGANVTQLYDIDSIAVRRIFNPVAATAPNRVFTDTFRNGNVANSDSAAGFWTQRNQGTSNVSETNATPANLAEPLKLFASGAGYPHAQIASGVRSEFNFFRTPIAIEAAGLGVSSTSNSTTVNTIGKSILRFSLASQGLSSGAQSEYTVPDALALRIEGGNVVTLGSKVNAPDQNTEFTNNLINQAVSGPVRRVKLVLHGTFYFLQVEHDLSANDSAQTTSEFSGPLSLNLADWNATGDAAMIVQGQLNNAAAGENMTALVDSLAVSAVRPAWAPDGDGAWGSAANWTDRPAPNYPGAHARFTDAIAADRTITTDLAAKAGTLTFDNADDAYTIGGTNAITLDTLVDTPRIEVLAGSHTIAAPLVLAKNTTIDAAAGSQITLSGPLSAANVLLTKAGAGAARVANVRAAGLSVAGGALRVLPDGGDGGTSNVGSLSIAGGGSFDLHDNDLVVRTGSVGSWNGSAYTGVTGLIREGRNGGDWAGSGLITSAGAAGDLRTLGVAAADDVGAAGAMWSGQSVAAGAVLVKYTYGGDANLDGKVNIDDYGQIDFNVGSSGSVFGWFNGDFNYDGKINIDDYGIIDFNVTAQESLLGDTTVGTAAVPEPTTLAAATLATLLLPRHRRRRHPVTVQEAG